MHSPLYVSLVDVANFVLATSTYASHNIQIVIPSNDLVVCNIMGNNIVKI